MSDMRLIVAGAGGRMGRALTRVIAETPGAVLAGALEAPGSELLGKDAGVLAGLPANGVQLSADLWSLSANADGILDFTVPGATIANVAIAAERGLVHVIGTTGLSASDDAVIRSVTSRAIVVQSGNMSLGVNLLAALVKRVAQSLDEGFDIEILEMHHRAKIDAPSGTACSAGTALHSGSFNANGTAATNQTLTVTVTSLAVGDRICLQTTGGANWTSGTSIGGITIFVTQP